MSENAFEHLANCRLCLGRNISLFDGTASIWRCRECGYFFDNPRPGPEEIERFYSRPVQYDAWLADATERERLWKRRLQKVLPYAKPGSLLDVGAGIGQFLALARNDFVEVAGTEVSSAAVKIAAQRYGLRLLQGRIEEIDFRHRTFDNITLFHVLEHVHEPLETLVRCRQLLSPGGVLFVAVPNEVSSLAGIRRRVLFRTGLKRVRRLGILGIPRIALDGSLAEIHLSHFTSGALSRALARNGFRTIDRGLDQYYVARGAQEEAATRRYNRYALFFAVTGINLYETMWLAARKI